MTTPTTKLRLVAYLRVSTARQEEDGFGLDVQSRAIKAWAKSNGHRLVGTFSESVTGSNGVHDREALPEALESIEMGRADGLVAYNLDRLARTLHVQEAILGQVWSQGGRMFTVESGEVHEDDPDDPMRKAMRQIRGVFSELERSMLLKRMRDGRRVKHDRGGYAYGSPSYGFKAKGKCLVPDDAEQAVIDRMRTQHAAGESLASIARSLNTDAIPTKRSGRWSAVQVARLLDPTARERSRSGTARSRSRVA